MDRLKWGILGTARIASVQVIPAILAGESGDLIAVASRSEAKARAVADQFSIPRAYNSYEALLADPDIEAVYVPLPNHLHREWTVRAAEAGKHVLCEKPLTVTAEEAQDIIAARDRNGVIIQEAFVFHHHPRWRWLRARLREGAFGEPRVVQAAYTHFNADPHNIRNQADLPGSGGMMDLGCYAVAGARFIFESEPRRALALVDLDPDLGVDRLGSVLLDFGDGRHAGFVVGKQTARQQWLSLTASDARVELPLAFHPARDRPAEAYTTPRDAGTATVHTFEPVAQFALQCDAFRDVVRGQAPQESPLEDALANMRCLDAIRHSATSGAWEEI